MDVLPSLMAASLSSTDKEDLTLYAPKLLAAIKTLQLSQASSETLRKIRKILP